MKHLKAFYFPVIIAALAVSVQSCKSKKKLVQAPDTTAQKPIQAAAPVPETKPEPPVQAVEPVPAVAPPNYNFKNIQFEFNSGVLKTESYPLLDAAVAEMKKDHSARFTLNGHSSAEGTDEHNKALSVERANAVKSYLVNGGIAADRLDIKGWGESKPLVSNATEEGRQLNRRVEIKLN